MQRFVCGGWRTTENEAALAADGDFVSAQEVAVPIFDPHVGEAVNFAGEIPLAPIDFEVVLAVGALLECEVESEGRACAALSRPSGAVRCGSRSRPTEIGLDLFPGDVGTLFCH